MDSFIQRQSVDLLRDNPILVRDQPIIKGDTNALRWIVTVTKGGVPVDFTGATASLYCARAMLDDESSGTTWSSAATTTDGTVTAVLPQDAANVAGPVGCTLRVTQNGASVTVARMAVMAIDPNGSDIVDVGKRMPNIDEVLAAVARCEEAASSAEIAANNANSAAAEIDSKIADKIAPTQKEVDQLKEDLKHTADNTGLGDKTIILDSWESGGYNADGTYVTSDKIRIQALIPLSKGQTYAIKCNGKTAMDVVLYVSDDFSGGKIHGWGVSTDIVLTMTNDRYLGIALRTSNLGAIKPVIAQKNVIALVENAIGNTAYTPPMMQYGTNSTDGSLVKRSDRICTEIKYHTEDVLSVSIGNGYQFILAQFNDSGDFLGNTGWTTTIVKSSIAGSNFRITVKANDESNILPNATTGLVINLVPQSTTELLLKLYDERVEREDYDAYLKNQIGDIEADVKSQINDIKSVVIADSIGFNQIARLGWKPYAASFPPEQSLASYKLAYSMGIRMLLADVRKTSDNVLVCFHDESINSTARNSDGSTISQTINIADHTLAELNAYDYGIYKGYPNEGILTLNDFLKLCGQINCIPILETKIWLLAEEVNSIVTMVRKYGLQEGFIWAEAADDTIATRTCTIIRQKLPNATIMIRGGSYSEMALSTAVAFSGADKKTILSFTDYTKITSETVATCRENNVDIEYSMVSTEADLDALYANSAFGDIRYIVCSEFNVHNYIMNKIGLTS